MHIYLGGNLVHIDNVLMVIPGFTEMGYDDLAHFYHAKDITMFNRYGCFSSMPNAFLVLLRTKTPALSHIIVTRNGAYTGEYEMLQNMVQLAMQETFKHSDFYQEPPSEDEVHERMLLQLRKEVDF